MVKAALLATVFTTAVWTESVQSQTVPQVNAANTVRIFTQLNNTAEGRALLQANLQTAISINRNSTVSERAQALTDHVLQFNGTGVGQGQGQRLNAIYQDQLLRGNPVFLPTGSFGQAITDVNAVALANSSAIKTIFANNSTRLSTTQTFTASNFSFPSDGITNVYGVAYGLSPGPLPNNPFGNPRPYQVAPEQIDFFAPTIQGGDTNSSPAFNSGHATSATAQALVLSIMIPERFQEMLVEGTSDSHSRIVLGVHYPLDIIGARIATLHDVAQMLNGNAAYQNVDTPFAQTGPVTSSNSVATFNAGMTDLRSALTTACGSTIEICARSSAGTDPYQNRASNKAIYEARLTYGLPASGSANLAPVVPVGAEVLLSTRFPYLSAQQRRDVLASTELPSGVPLDDGSGWARLNLFAAADGYATFGTTVSIDMNATLGGFHALDAWRNDIGGAGGLVKAGAGTLILTGTNSWRGATTISGGTLLLTGVGNLPVTTALTNNATLSMQNGDVTGRVAVASYSGGSGSVLQVDVSEEGADQLRITGSLGAGSTTTVLLNPNGTRGNFSPNGTVIVDASGATGVTSSNFTLGNTGNEIKRGLFSESLLLNNQGQFILVTLPNSHAREAAALLGSLTNMSLVTTQEWIEQRASGRLEDVGKMHAWASSFTRRNNGRIDGLGYRQSPAGVAAGLDLPVKAMEGLALGFSVQYLSSDLRFSSGGSAAATQKGFGLSASYAGETSIFWNLGIRRDWLDGSYSAPSLANFGSFSSSPKTTMTSIVANAGVSFSLGRIVIEPQISAVYSNMDSDRLVLGGSSVLFSKNDTGWGGAGVRARIKADSALNVGASATYWHAFADLPEVLVSGPNGVAATVTHVAPEERGAINGFLSYRLSESVLTSHLSAGAEFYDGQVQAAARLGLSLTF
jgi:autotransporter-associated beta strand protein